MKDRCVRIDPSHPTGTGENIGEAGPEADTTAAIAAAAVGLTRDMLNEKPPDDRHRLNTLSSSFAYIGTAPPTAPTQADR